MSSLATLILNESQDDIYDSPESCTSTYRSNSRCNSVVDMTNENNSSPVLTTDKGNSDLKDADISYSNADLRLLYPLGFRPGFSTLSPQERIHNLRRLGQEIYSSLGFSLDVTEQTQAQISADQTSGGTLPEKTPLPKQIGYHDPDYERLTAIDECDMQHKPDDVDPPPSNDMSRNTDQSRAKRIDYIATLGGVTELRSQDKESSYPTTRIESRSRSLGMKIVLPPHVLPESRDHLSEDNTETYSSLDSDSFVGGKITWDEIFAVPDSPPPTHQPAMYLVEGSLAGRFLKLRT